MRALAFVLLAAPAMAADYAGGVPGAEVGRLSGNRPEAEVVMASRPISTVE